MLREIHNVESPSVLDLASVLESGDCSQGGTERESSRDLGR
jgi:hypothetical protein